MQLISYEKGILDKYSQAQKNNTHITVFIRIGHAVNGSRFTSLMYITEKQNLLSGRPCIKQYICYYE